MVDPRDLGLVDPGPLAAPGGADDLPVRGGARRDRAVGAALATPRGADRRRRGPDPRLRLRGGCPACTGPRLEPDVDAQGARAPAPRTSSRAARRPPRSRHERRDARAAARELPRRALAAGSRADGHGPAADDRPRARCGSRSALGGDVDGELPRSGGRSCAASRRPSSCRSTASALARLPGQPPPDVPLVCLDTETTGLATAAGTIAFLVGLGWWEGDRFRQVQLLLPDHAERAGAARDARGPHPADRRGS